MIEPVIERVLNKHSCKSDVSRLDRLGSFRIFLVLLIALSVLACLPAFHASSGIDAIDAFDQGISSPVQKGILGAIVAHDAPLTFLLRGLNPGPTSRMRT
ncbi:MAG: hypothetical protein Q7U89_05370 [Coriobacteriia bacterium]|nr:hypothetical protein [Coriobacteriia bacterium]